MKRAPMTRRAVIRELAEMREDQDRAETLEALALAQLPLEVEPDHVAIPDPAGWVLP